METSSTAIKHGLLLCIAMFSMGDVAANDDFDSSRVDHNLVDDAGQRQTLFQAAKSRGANAWL